MSTSDTPTPEPTPNTDDLIARLTVEGPIGMSAAAKLYGSARGGRPAHPSTPLRHCLHGVKLKDGRTLRLEHFTIAGRVMTSRPAVLRFFAAQQPPPPPASGTLPTPGPTPSRTPTRRQRESKRAEETLKSRGV